MNIFSPALSHFLLFHKGLVNVLLHLFGFIGIGLSLVHSNWMGFAMAALVLEAGHLYNHFRGIKRYDLRPKVLLLRLLFFLLSTGLICLILHG